MQGAAQALQGLLDKLPPGWAWTREPDSSWGRTFAPLADAVVAFERAAEAMLPEGTPSTSAALLEDYERVLGPDPCMGVQAVTTDDRRRSVHIRWVGTQGAARRDYVQLAAALGYAITIDEFRPARAGRLRAGQRCYGRRVQWTWRVNLPSTRVVLFRAGRSRAGDRLRQFGLPWLQCQIARNAPAHTVLVFANTTASPELLTTEFGAALADETAATLRG